MRELSGGKLPDDSQILYGFIAKTGELIGKKYDLSLSGTGGGGDEEGIYLMNVSFHRYGTPLKEEQARRLIVDCVTDFLEKANSDPQLRPYLKSYPFKNQNINLYIVNHLANGHDVFFPYIRTVSADEGKISYFTKDESNQYGYKTEKYETYEEALAILAKEQITECKEGASAKVK